MNVVLADDHALVREGLRAILDREPDVHVVGEATDGREALALTLALRPDVVVMDVSMPGLNGIEATRRIVAAMPDARVLGLSVHVDRQYVHALFEAGAMGYLLKSAASEELLHALRVVAGGRTYVSPAVAGVVVEVLRQTQPPVERPATLTAREREVVQLLAEGATSKQIAATLDIALSTVETHRRHVMEKLDVKSIAELTKYAIRHGITSIE